MACLHLRSLCCSTSLTLTYPLLSMARPCAAARWRSNFERAREIWMSLFVLRISDISALPGDGGPFRLAQSGGATRRLRSPASQPAFSSSLQPALSPSRRHNPRSVATAALSPLPRSPTSGLSPPARPAGPWKTAWRNARRSTRRRHPQPPLVGNRTRAAGGSAVPHLSASPFRKGLLLLVQAAKRSSTARPPAGQDSSPNATQCSSSRHRHRGIRIQPVPDRMGVRGGPRPGPTPRHTTPNTPRRGPRGPGVAGRARSGWTRGARHCLSRFAFLSGEKAPYVQVGLVRPLLWPVRAAREW